ncbi:MAG: chromosomal replication initiator protein DnaA [Eubacteriales bacterium]|nr:chromosomal replication initiator protein DnaA [Eubacteriales bacterium]
MPDAVQLWNSIMSIIQNDVIAISFKTFILPIQAGIIHAHCLYLECPNDIVQKTVSSKYLKLITKTAQELEPSLRSVQLLSATELENFKLSIEEQKEETNNINKKYTFDNFVVGNNNRFVYTVALAVAEQPAEVYNPLFIHGGVGLGKTHMLHAIGNFIQEFTPEMRVKYVTAEAFMNDLIKNLQGKEASAAFRNRYRNLDVLMIDDIQFIAGKQATQEEFFHTFNALHELGKQIIITCDKHPNAIEHLEERLSSRFQWGLIADIQSPDIETRIAILKKKAEQNHIIADDECFTLIAEKIDSNIRELEGALTKIRAFASMNNRPIDVAMVSEALRDTKPKNIDIAASFDRVLSIVSSHYGITVADLKSAKRSKEISEPRQIAMYLVREILAMPYTKIGKSFGGKDHSTVMHACSKVADAKSNSTRLAAEITDLIKMIDIN